jgi:hypothetical protein
LNAEPVVEFVSRGRGEVAVFNLTVADLHTYFVAVGDASVHVHNDLDPCLPAYLDDHSIDKVENLHTATAANRDLIIPRDKSVFCQGTDYQALVDHANKRPCLKNEHGNFERRVQSPDGQSVGGLGADFGGFDMDWYVVAQDKWGFIVSIHPVVPPGVAP